MFIHGLWLKPSSWDRWAGMFEAAGYAAMAPGRPAEAGGAAAPETIGEVAAHFSRVAAALDRRPERQKRNPHAVTEFAQLPQRGHSLTFDSGWMEVAETALNFVRRFL